MVNFTGSASLPLTRNYRFKSREWRKSTIWLVLSTNRLTHPWLGFVGFIELRGIVFHWLTMYIRADGDHPTTHWTASVILQDRDSGLCDTDPFLSIWTWLFCCLLFQHQLNVYYTAGLTGIKAAGNDPTEPHEREDTLPATSIPTVTTTQ